MKNLVAILVSITAVVLVGAGLRDQSHGVEPGGTTPGRELQRSEEVVREKIRRKQDKLEGRAGRPENPDGYAEYRRASRGYPDGTTLTELQMAALRHKEGMPRIPLEKDAGLWTWEWIGPGNIGGRVRAVLVHPAQPNVLWAGGAGGGVWKSTDGGSSWFALQNFLPSINISAMVMDPNDPDIIYAATGEGLARGANPGAGIFKTTDGGDTWDQLPNSFDSDYAWINDLIIHPTDSDILFAAVQKWGRNDGDGRVWRSEDAGETWINVLDTPTPAMDLGIDPDNPNVVIMSYYNGVYRSAFRGDAGLWSEISTGLAGKLPDDTGRTTFAFGEGNDYVYASCDVPSGDPQGEIWRSTDNGVTWYKRSTPWHLGSQGHYDNVIWLQEGTTDNIVFGGINLYRSLDGGSTYTIISDWRYYHHGNSAHADQHAITPAPGFGTTNSTIYFGNDGGVQKNVLGFSAEPLFGWVNLANNLGITQFYKADVNATGSLIVGGTQDNDSLRFRRANGPQGWFQAETGDGSYCAIHPVNTDIIYTSYPRLKIEKSYDGGDSYSSSHTGIGDAGVDEACLFVAPFVLDKLDPRVLVAGSQSIWVSTNAAANWNSVLGPRPDGPIVTTLEISPSQGSAVTWAGYTDGSILKTEGSLQTWSEVEPSTGGVLPDKWVLDIEISPHDPDMVLVCFGGYKSDKVWISFNRGQSFQHRSGTGNAALPEIQVNTVTFHPNNPSWIYAGTDVGLFASEDLGVTWSVTPAASSNEGPVNAEVSDLLWHSGETLLVVTHGRGMYECRPLWSVYVDQAHSGAEDGTLLKPFNTFGEGYDFIGPGSTLIVGDGQYDENIPLIDKRILLKGTGGSAVIK